MKLPKICIISDKDPAYSETFICDHIERLPAKIIFLNIQRLFKYDTQFRKQLHEYIANPFLRNNAIRVLDFLCYLEYKYITKTLQRNQVQAVLAEYGNVGAILKETCHKLKIPLIVHFHGYDAYTHRVLNEKGKEYPILFQKAAAIVAVSKDMERQLIKLGAPKQKIHYNPYGIDLNLFQATRPDKNPPNFLAVGRFVDKKAPFLTILAFKSITEIVPQARLKMIGDGKLLETCQRLVWSLSLSEKVEFLGTCSHQEVAAAMQTARAFVQHSVQSSSGDSEGTPVGILEASASALPVIATRHAGIKDVIIENETGFLVNEGDIGEMSQHILNLAENPDLALKLGKAGRDRIQKEFSMDKSIRKLWSIIEEQIKSRPN